MVQPFDYSLGALDPVAAMQSGMAFGQNQRANEQAMVMNDQNMELNAADEARTQTAFGQQNLLFDQGQTDRAAAQEAAQAMQGKLVALAETIETGNYSWKDFAAIGAEFPGINDELSTMWEGLSSERKAADVSELRKGVAALAAGRPDLTVQMLEDRAVAAENAGDQAEADFSRAMAQSIKADPTTGMVSMGLLLQSVDPEAAASVLGEGLQVHTTTISADGTTVTLFTDGKKEVTDVAGNVMSGTAAQEAVDAANASEAETRRANAEGAADGRLSATVETGDEAAAAEARGSLVGKAEGEAITEEGQIKSDADRFIALIEEVEKDPALPSVLGNYQGRLPAGIPFITGGQAGTDVAVKMEQLTGQAFIAAYNNIRGAGAITDQEGKAATAAEQRLNTRQSEKAYLAALAEAKALLQARVKKAQDKADAARGAGAGSGSPEAVVPDDIGLLMQGP